MLNKLNFMIFKALIVLTPFIIIYSAWGFNIDGGDITSVIALSLRKIDGWFLVLLGLIVIPSCILLPMEFFELNSKPSFYLSKVFLFVCNAIILFVLVSVIAFIIFAPYLSKIQYVDISSLLSDSYSQLFLYVCLSLVGFFSSQGVMQYKESNKIRYNYEK